MSRNKDSLTLKQEANIAYTVLFCILFMFFCLDSCNNNTIIEKSSKSFNVMVSKSDIITKTNVWFRDKFRNITEINPRGNNISGYIIEKVSLEKDHNLNRYNVDIKILIEYELNGGVYNIKISTISKIYIDDSYTPNNTTLHMKYINNLFKSYETYLNSKF